jgi:hypothetical protein
MKPISATHVDSDGLVQPSRQIPAAITAHKFLDNADRIFTQPGSILLKKSIFSNVQNFPEALVRLSENYMGGHMSSPISNRQAS